MAQQQYSQHDAAGQGHAPGARQPGPETGQRAHDHQPGKRRQKTQTAHKLMPQGQATDLRREAGFGPGKKHNQNKGQHKGRIHGGQALHPLAAASPHHQPARKTAAEQGQHGTGKAYHLKQALAQPAVVFLPAQAEQLLKNGHVRRAEGPGLGQRGPEKSQHRREINHQAQGAVAQMGMQLLSLRAVQGKGQKKHGPGIQGADAVHPHAQARGQHGRRPQGRTLPCGQGRQQQKGPERGEENARDGIRVRDAPEGAPAHPDGDAHQQRQQRGQGRAAEQPAARQIPARVKHKHRQGPGPEQAPHILVARGQQTRGEAFQIPDAVGRRSFAQHGVSGEELGMGGPGHALGVGGKIAVQMRASGGNGQHALQGGPGITGRQAQEQCVPEPAAARRTGLRGRGDRRMGHKTAPEFNVQECHVLLRHRTKVKAGSRAARMTPPRPEARQVEFFAPARRGFGQNRRREHAGAS